MLLSVRALYVAVFIPDKPVEEAQPLPTLPPPPVISVDAPPVEEIGETVKTAAQGMVEDILKKAIGKKGHLYSN